jgi:hypothetical protein
MRTAILRDAKHAFPFSYNDASYKRESDSFSVMQLAGLEGLALGTFIVLPPTLSFTE